MLMLLLLLSHQRSLQAELVFAFNSSGVDETTPRQVVEGGTIDIPIYLVQTNLENRLSSIGLFSSGVTLTYLQNSGPGGLAKPMTGTLAPHWTGEGNFTNHDLEAATFVMEGLINDPSSPVLATNNAILLGNVTFSAGTLGNLTSLSLSLNSNTPFSNLFVDIDETFPDNDLVFRSASLATVTAVPEPSSLVVGVLAVACGAVKFRRRRLSHKFTQMLPS